MVYVQSGKYFEEKKSKLIWKEEFRVNTCLYSMSPFVEVTLQKINASFVWQYCYAVAHVGKWMGSTQGLFVQVSFHYIQWFLKRRFSYFQPVLGHVGHLEWRTRLSDNFRRGTSKDYHNKWQIKEWQTIFKLVLKF